MMILSVSKNDSRARVLIVIVSLIVFAAVALLGRVKLEVNLGFDEHVFARINALINSVVAILLLSGLIMAKQKKFTVHRNIMLTAIVLSVLFLISYICHHLFAGEARFGDIDHNKILSEQEKVQAGSLRYIYYFILSTHIVLASIVLPFILFTAYRALINEYAAHRKLAKITWPIWFYVAVTGPLVYFLIQPYY
jgi:putative membrane protein